MNPPNTECTVLDMWPDTPPLARDYAFASGVRSGETIAQLDEHHQHLREKARAHRPTASCMGESDFRQAGIEPSARRDNKLHQKLQICFEFSKICTFYEYRAKIN